MAIIPTIQTYFDNRDGLMLLRESSKFFNCDYNPLYKDIPLSLFAELRTAAKNETAVSTKKTFLCGCCKRPLKISGGLTRGRKRFHFMHISTPEKDECPFYEGRRFTADEVKAMIFNGRTEGVKHIQDKKDISEALRNEREIKEVAVEKVATGIGNTWRRPDIKAVFLDHTVVFEVQLSPIFHHVILERNDVYRDYGWYIMWIFEDVNEDNPLMRELDAWVNNNYNIFGFDGEAKRLTRETGSLHLTVKYSRFMVNEDGLNSRLKSEWTVETVPFSSLTVDSAKRMIYLFDSERNKDECLDKISNIIAECIQKTEKEKILHQKKLEEQRKEYAEAERLRQEKAKVSNFIRDVEFEPLTYERFRLVLDYVDEHSKNEIEKLLSALFNLRMDLDELNQWLKVVSEIVKRRGVGKETTIYLWREIIYRFRKENRKIEYLSLHDYLLVMGPQRYEEILPRLLDPFDEATTEYVESITPGHPDFEGYAPLILLSRYYRFYKHIPERVIKFFSDQKGMVYCLISAQMGRPFGTGFSNLKQVANLVWDRYRDNTNLFIFLIERNNHINKLCGGNAKAGREAIDHYHRLKEFSGQNSFGQGYSLSFEELEILFPEKRQQYRRINNIPPIR